MSCRARDRQAGPGEAAGCHQLAAAPTGQGLFTSRRREGCRPAASRQVGSENYREGRGQTPLNIWKGSPQAGPGGARRPGAGGGGHKDPAAPPRVALLLPQFPWPQSGERQQERRGAGLPGLPAQARARRRRRRRNAGPAAGFRAPRLLPSSPRRSADPSAERPPAPRRLGPVPAPRPREDVPPPPVPSGRAPRLPPPPGAPKPPAPPARRATWIRFLCRLRSAMLAAPPGSF